MPDGGMRQGNKKLTAAGRNTWVEIRSFGRYTLTDILCTN